MDVSIPSDVWLLIATNLARTTGRNDVLSLRATSKTLKDALQDSATLWKEMIFQLHFRLFDKADPSLIASMTAANWRKLLFGFSALGLRSAGDKVNFLDETRNNVFSWNDALDPKLDGENPADEDSSRECLKWNKRVIYSFEKDINTAGFWFSHRKAADGTPLDIKIADLVNGDPMRQIESGDFVSLINNDELIQSLYSIFPRPNSDDSMQLTAFHTVIVPEYVDANATKPHVVDPLYERNVHATKLERNISCYRYKSPANPLPVIAEGANYVYHVLLPLQDPDRVGFNEERIAYYQNQMRQGVLPTVLALTTVQNKYRLMNSSSGFFDFRSQLVMIDLIIDGHHKLEAARRMNWPVGILMICDDSRRSILENLRKPVPCMPFSSLEFMRHFNHDGPYMLFFDNFLESYGEEYSLSEQRSALERLLCRGGHRPEDVFRNICIPMEATPFQNCLMHGGLIEFTSYEQMMRVLRECSGQIENSLGPIVFQIPTAFEAANWDLRYDLSTPGEPRAVRCHHPDDGIDSMAIRNENRDQ